MNDSEQPGAQPQGNQSASSVRSIQTRLDEFLSGNLRHGELEELQMWLRISQEGRRLLVDRVMLDEMICESLESKALVEVVDLYSGPNSGNLLESGIEPGKLERHPRSKGVFSAWRRVSRVLPWGIAVLTVVMATVTAMAVLPRRPVVAQVAGASGVSLFLGANGTLIPLSEVGGSLVAGDALETRSCDASIDLSLGGDSSWSLVGNSYLRILESRGSTQRLLLRNGTVWISDARVDLLEGDFSESGADASASLSKRESSQNQGSDALQVKVLAREESPRPWELILPTSRLVSQGAILNVQTSEADSIVRVDAGRVLVYPLIGNQVLVVPSGHQVHLSLRGGHQPRVTRQPETTDHWHCDLGLAPTVLLGRWRPAGGDLPVSLEASPLLWSLPDQDPVVLFAVAVAVWRSSPQPVQLHTDSVLRVRGQIDDAQNVRFGLSTQRRHGVFSGKFEVELAASELGKVGEIWEIEIPLKRFHPLQPELATSLEGLELTDVYALTIERDAGLKVLDLEIKRSEHRGEQDSLQVY